MVETEIRRADLNQLVDLLNRQKEVRHDYVVPSSQMRLEGGRLVLPGLGKPARIDEDGVTAPTDLALNCAPIFDEGMSAGLKIPRDYVRRMRDTAAKNENDARYPELLDHNFNVWMADTNRSWLVRTFHGDGDETGSARSLLSNKYGALDNLDVILAALAGIRAAGVQVKVVNADLSERRMRVRLEAPEITCLAPSLLDRYRSPFSGEAGRDLPVVAAGLALDNSETGGGATSVAPWIRVQVCKNGMTVTKDAVRKVHLGSRLGDGVVDWSSETIQRNISLITSQATDAVREFLKPSFLEAKVREIEGLAGHPVTEPTKTIERVVKRFGFTETEQELILADFIAGGDATAGGIMQAVTSTAQRVESPDRAAVLEDSALDVLALVAE